MFKFITGLLLFSLPSLAFASTALIDSKWLADNLENKELLLVDLRPLNQFEYAHAKGSSHTDYALWRQPKNAVLQKELPLKQHLEKLMSDIGATADSHIILMASGQSANDLASATRIYWTLEQIGHEKKSILNGGILAYANARLPLVRGPLAVKPTEYKIKHMKTNQINADLIHQNKKLNIIDTRSKAEHLGIYLGAPDERPGAIPASSSLPYDWFTQNGSGWFADKNNLQTLVDTLDINPDQDTVLYCHTGHRASLSWFVLQEILGNEKAILYDASFREWGTRDELPVVQHVGIKH